MWRQRSECGRFEQSHGTQHDCMEGWGNWREAPGLLRCEGTLRLARDAVNFHHRSSMPPLNRPPVKPQCAKEHHRMHGMVYQRRYQLPELQNNSIRPRDGRRGTHPLLPFIPAVHLSSRTRMCNQTLSAAIWLAERDKDAGPSVHVSAAAAMTPRSWDAVPCCRFANADAGAAADGAAGAAACARIWEGGLPGMDGTGRGE